jgi:elongation factor Ts
MNGKIGVLVEVNCESDFVARNEEFQELVKNICLHIAAAAPKYISSEDVPQEILDEERDIIREQFKDSGKPPEIVEKIVQGKLSKYYQEACLLDQPYIKEDKMAVKELITAFISKFRENVVIRRFVRYELGES